MQACLLPQAAALSCWRGLGSWEKSNLSKKLSQLSVEDVAVTGELEHAGVFIPRTLDVNSEMLYVENAIQED